MLYFFLSASARTQSALKNIHRERPRIQRILQRKANNIMKNNHREIAPRAGTN